MSSTPTPIDPADIRAGDVVEIREVVTVVEAASDYGHVVRSDGTARTWHLIHRPDPDAEAVEALRVADDEAQGRIGCRNNGEALLALLREQGWDVRRAES